MSQAMFIAAVDHSALDHFWPEGTAAWITFLAVISVIGIVAASGIEGMGRTLRPKAFAFFNLMIILVIALVWDGVRQREQLDTTLEFSQLVQPPDPAEPPTIRKCLPVLRDDCP